MDTRESDFSYRLWRYDGAPGELIPLLQSAQDYFGYIPTRAIRHISGATRIPESRIYGVITFYNQFRLQPIGKHVIRLCTGTACHVAGVQVLVQAIEEELGVEMGGTTEDGIFTFSTAACLGCCSLAPVMMIDDETHGKLTSALVRKILRKIRREESKRVVKGPAAA
ncbi:MAG: NADH-quinone oxidoreductase subunit NuoE [Candidatus Eisenbacteria sp.]|nr:NADH-quinone oxidoreductase subunit NuoE [Candidatus Eisenbacteria bacterium]